MFIFYVDVDGAFNLIPINRVNTTIKKVFNMNTDCGSSVLSLHQET